jgi:hypothetical protein
METVLRPSDAENRVVVSKVYGISSIEGLIHNPRIYYILTTMVLLSSKLKHITRTEELSRSSFFPFGEDSVKPKNKVLEQLVKVTSFHLC